MSDEEKLKIIIEAQNKAKAAFDEAQKQIDDTGNKFTSMADKMDAAGKKMQGVGKKMTMGLTLPILALGAVSFKAAAEMQDSMGAVEQIFKKSGNTVKNWADKLPTYYGIAKTEALQYSSTMGSMMKNIGGMTEAEAAKSSGKLIELAGDLTAMFGGTTQDAVRALTGALKGNNTMLDNYGISALEAEVKAEAMRKGLMKADVNMAKVEEATIKVDEARKKSFKAIKDYGKGSEEARKASNELALAQQGVETAMAGSTSEMDVATKQAATLSLIMSQTKDVQGQAAREADGGSGKLRAMQTEMKNLSAEVGGKLLPVGIKLLGWASSLMDKFGKLSSKAQNIILIVLGLGAALGPVVYIVGTFTRSIKATIDAAKKAHEQYGKLKDKAVSAFTKMAEVSKTAASKTKELASATSDYSKKTYSSMKMSAQYKAHLVKENALKVAAKTKTVALTVAEKARMVATKIATAAQAAFNLVMSVNPIFLIIAAIIAFVAIMVVLYKKNEAVRNFIDAAWRGIVSVVKWAWETVLKPLWDAIVFYVTNMLIPYFKLLWSVLQAAWNGIVAVVKWAWENVIKPIWDLIYWYVTTVLIPVWTKIWEVAVWVWNKVVEGIQAAWNFIKPIWDSIWAFITEKLVPAFQKIWDKVSDVFTKVWNTISGWVTNIKDGFDKVKGWIATLVEKFNDIKDKVSEAFGNVADAITKPFKSAFNTVVDLWNKSIGKISIDLPDWLGGKKFSMPKLDKLYKGTRNWSGGPAIVGDVNGRGGEIVNLPGGTDVFSNRESKQILRSLASGQGGGGNTFTGNIILGDASAVKEFFKKLDRDADRASMGVPV